MQAKFMISMISVLRQTQLGSGKILPSNAKSRPKIGHMIGFIVCNQAKGLETISSSFGSRSHKNDR